MNDFDFLILFGIGLCSGDDKVSEKVTDRLPPRLIYEKPFCNKISLCAGYKGE
jgi:hypothetical protein